jgi:hypothetical protein
MVWTVAFALLGALIFSIIIAPVAGQPVLSQRDARVAESSQSHVCVMRMRLETKFLRLKIPVTVGSRFGAWQVSWVGGWTKHRLSFLVIMVRVVPPPNKRRVRESSRVLFRVAKSSWSSSLRDLPFEAMVVRIGPSVE